MCYEGLLVVISGPSGVGKGTICKELMKKSINNIELSVSTTTRKPRNGEVEGISYYFRGKHEFEEMIKYGQFLEYAKVYNNYYGTPKAQVLSKLKEGRDIILEIDTQGAMQVKRNFKEGVFIFIMPPSFNELKKRITSRGTESEQDIKKRLRCAFEEIKQVNNYDYVVVNDDIDKAVKKIDCIIHAEKCRLCRYQIDFSEFKEEL